MIRGRLGKGGEERRSCSRKQIRQPNLRTRHPWVSTIQSQVVDHEMSSAGCLCLRILRVACLTLTQIIFYLDWLRLHGALLLCARLLVWSQGIQYDHARIAAITASFSQRSGGGALSMGKAKNHRGGHWLCDWRTAVSYNIAAPSCEEAYQNLDTRGSVMRQSCTVIMILKPHQRLCQLTRNPG
jgi:hypothetical protein